MWLSIFSRVVSARLVTCPSRMRGCEFRISMFFLCRVFLFAVLFSFYARPLSLLHC
jgi:hypothetical protein